MKKQSGFTLIELMIVVAIIAIIAAIAIPNLLSARLNANETAAISTLRNISSSQAQFQATAKADTDNDGTGEFGMFRELSGGVGVRTANTGTSTAASTLNPTVLSGAFRTLNAKAEISRSGYLFQMFLPAADGTGLLEATGANDSVVGTVGEDLAETSWCAYAWPANYSTSGNRTFFCNQTGDITGKDDSTMSGTGKLDGSNTAKVSDAFHAGAADDEMTGSIAVGTKGKDGTIWKQIN